MKAIILVAIFKIAVGDVFPAEPPTSNVPIAPIPVNFIPSSPSISGSILPPYQVIGTPQDQIQLSEYPAENLNHLLLTDDVTALKSELSLPEIHIAKAYKHYSEPNYENMLRFLQQLRNLLVNTAEPDDSSLSGLIQVPFGVYGPPEIQPKATPAPPAVYEHKTSPPPLPVPKYEAPPPIPKYEAPAEEVKYEAPPLVPKYEAPPPIPKYEAPAQEVKYEVVPVVPKYEAPPPIPKYEAPPRLHVYPPSVPIGAYSPPAQEYRPVSKYEAPPLIPVYIRPVAEYGPPAQEYGVPPSTGGVTLLDTHILPGTTNGQEHFPGVLIPSNTSPHEQVLKLPPNTQVNIIDDKNQYSHGFSQPDGTRVSEQGTLISTDNGWEYVIAKTGYYEYVSPEGTPIRVDWIADDKGYRATLTNPEQH